MSDKKRHPVAKGTAGVAIVALLLAGGLKLGIVPGGERVGLSPAETEVNEEQEPVEENKEEREAKNYDILVSEKEITLNGDEITLEELSLALDDVEEGDSVSLKEDNAIKETYESIMDLLQEKGVDYIRSEKNE